ncbi:MAG: PAS domain S-box protein [Actinomycetota bacterium]
MTDEQPDAIAQEAEAKYRVLVEHLPAIVYTSEIGTEGNWLYVSPKMHEILGWSPEEWIAHEAPWKTSVHPDDLERATAETLAAAEQGAEDRIVTIEYRMFTRDGHLLWIRDESTVVHDEAGTPLCLQGVMYDISESKRASEERDFHARLLESISDAVIAYDSDLTVTAWNRAAQVLYGWAAQEIIGQPLPEALRREAPEVATIWDPFVDALHGWRGRSIHVDKDGFELTIETKCVPLPDADGHERGWVMVDREVADS